MCGSLVLGEAIRGGGVLDRCTRCGHLARDLGRCPADHRDLAYGGEPTLDRIRLDLTHRELVRDGLPARVLEIGYGSGALLRRFLDDGAEVSGVDPDQLLVDVDPVVRARGDLRVGGIEDASALPDEQDLVYGVHVLEHVADPHRALAASHDLLRPGGRVSFLTPAGDSTALERYGAAWWMLEDPTHVRFFTADSLARAAAAAGFVDIEVRRLLLDSLSVDAASLARALRPGPRPHGVLGSRAVVASAVASLPLVLAQRLVRPRTRPTLQLIARRPDGSGGHGGVPPMGDVPMTSPPAAHRGIRRSVRLFSSFLVEQTDPHRFYSELAADSIDLLREHTDLRGRTVLDVGAGPSEFAQAFHDEGARYLPLDHDATVASVSEQGVVGDARQLPLADGSVDVVFSSNMWEHVPDPEAVADELLRVTRPGGIVFLSYTNWLSPWGGHETSPWHWLGGQRAIRRYERKHGHAPKNRVGETLHRVSVRQGLEWARSADADVLAARPRYLPDWCAPVLRLPGVREVVTWNLLLILRRR